MNPKPLVASPRFSGDGYGFNGLNVANIRSNSYGSNLFKLGGKYTETPISLSGITNGMALGLEVNSNLFEKLKGNMPNNNPVSVGYGVASLNEFERVQDHMPVFSGHGVSSTYGYATGNNGLQNSFMAGDYKTQKPISYGAGNIGRGFKYTNVMLPTQYITNEYEPGKVRWYGNGVMLSKDSNFNPSPKQEIMTVAPKIYGYTLNANQESQRQQSGNTKNNGKMFEDSKLVAQVPEFSQNNKQELMDAVPKGFALNQIGNNGFDGYIGQQFGNSFQNTPQYAKTNGYTSGYSSVPSLESSLKNMYKVVSEEKRKSNGKAIFLVGKIEIPGHMSANLPGYSAPTSFSNTFNAFSAYKYL
ncbi:hypothetical protein CBL_01530 [Carabus blaptoides fortunei]